MSATPAAKASLVRIGGVATLAMLCGTLLQFTIAALAPFIVEALSISRREFGLVLAVMFAVSALASGLAGRLVDRYALRSGLVTFFFLCAAVQVLASLPLGFGVLVTAAAVGGLPLALSYPITNKLIALRAEGRKRGLVIGIKQSGGQIGAIVAGAALPSLAVYGGWHVAVASGVTFAVVGLLATMIYVSPSTPDSSTCCMRVGELPGESRGAVAVRPLAWYVLYMGIAHSVLVGYLSLYAFDVLGTSGQRAGAVTAALGASAFVGRIVWGMSAVRTGRYRRALTVSPILAIVGVGLVALSPFHQDLVFIGAVLVGLTGLSWSAIVATTVVAGSDSDDTGQLSGAVIRPAFVAFALAPPAFGALVDYSGSYSSGWLIVGLAFLAAAVSGHRLPIVSNRKDKQTRVGLGLFFK